MHKVRKRKGLTASNVEWFANAIEIGAIKLAELQGQSQSLQNEILDKQCQKQQLQRALQVINKRIVELAGIEKMHQQNFDTLANKVCDLQNQKHQLEQLVSRFKTSNKSTLKSRVLLKKL